ncbi:serine hydrolase domain-containing protein [Lysobacter sp. A421]
MNSRLFTLAIAVLALAWASPAPAADLPSAAAESALQRILDGGRDSHSDSVLVLADGVELGHYYRDDKAPGPIELMSATKSVVALGIGQLIGQERIESLDQPVADFYPEWKQGKKRDITVRMLLNHTSGLQNVARAPAEIYPAPDVVQLALAAELSGAPGAGFSYNNKATNLLAGIIEKASGQPMDVFFREGLFAELDVTPGEWGKDKAGNPYVMAGLPLDATDAAKIGQLVLARGKWHGKQLVPAGYMDAMLSPGQSLEPSCGLLWWLRPAWMHFHFDPDSLAMLREKGVAEDLIQTLEQALTGARFDGSGAMMTGLYERLGEDVSRVREELVGKHGIGPSRLFTIEQGPVAAYEAQGYLGQYIVVVPSARLVAVRQVASPAGDETPPVTDGYGDFTQRVLDLARAMGRLPPEPTMAGVSGTMKPNTVSLSP